MVIVSMGSVGVRKTVAVVLVALVLCSIFGTAQARSKYDPAVIKNNMARYKFVVVVLRRVFLCLCTTPSTA